MKNKLIGIVLVILLALALAIIAWLGYTAQQKKNAFAALEVEVASLHGQVAEITAENEGLAAETEGLAAENAALAGENESLAAEIASAHEVNAALEAEAASLRTELEETAAKITALEQQVAALEADAAAYEEQIAGFVSSGPETEPDETVQQLTAELEAANSRIAELEGMLPALTTPDEAAQTCVTVPDEVAVAADGTVADLGFCNDNDSYFAVRVSLLVDGAVVYRSGELDPGEELERVTLQAPLAAGTYEGYLAWEVRGEDGEPVSSAMVAVTVVVE